MFLLGHNLPLRYTVCCAFAFVVCRYSACRRRLSVVGRDAVQWTGTVSVDTRERFQLHAVLVPCGGFTVAVSSAFSQPVVYSSPVSICIQSLMHKHTLADFFAVNVVSTDTQRLSLETAFAQVPISPGMFLVLFSGYSEVVVVVVVIAVDL